MTKELSSVEWEFDETSEPSQFPRIAPGAYLCRVEESRPGVTRSGHLRWGLKFVVHEGPETGRVAAWDGLVFSPKAAPRTRQVLAALGLPHEGKVRLTATDLVGRLAHVTVEEQVYRDPATGVTTKRNAVPFGGVRPVEGRPPSPENGEEETTSQAKIPF